MVVDRNFTNLAKDHYYLTVMDYPARCVCDDLCDINCDALCLVFQPGGFEEPLKYLKDGREYDLPFVSEITIVSEITFEEYETRMKEIISTGEVLWSNGSDTQPHLDLSAWDVIS